MKRPFFKKLLLAVVGLAFLASVGSGVFFYLRYQSAQKLLKNFNVAGQLELQELVTKVGKLIVLPQNETPTLATVTDVDKLKEQDFFKDAKNGDKVLIYPNGKLVILYNPTIGKIVAVGPLNIGTGSPAPASSQAPPQQTTPVKVAIYNGTTTAGLSRTIEPQLTSQVGNLEIVVREKAVAVYAKTKVVDLSGKQTDLSSRIATALKGEVVSMPEGEVKPENAEILIILGK